MHTKMKQRPQSPKMKQQPQSPTFDQFRLHQLAAVCKPVWYMAICFHATAMLKCIMQLISGSMILENSIQLADLTFSLALDSLTTVVLHTRRAWLPAGCITAHLLRSCLHICSGLGLAPQMESMSTCLKLRVELVVETAVTFQDQLSLPIMAVLHAVRQFAWMLLLVNHLHVDPYQALKRGLCNWLFMMAVSCVFEMHTWAAYRRLCHQQQQEEEKQQEEEQQEEEQQQGKQQGQQQEQQQQPSLPRPAPSLPLIEGASEFTSHLPEPIKPTQGEGSGSRPRRSARQDRAAADTAPFGAGLPAATAAEQLTGADRAPLRAVAGARAGAGIPVAAAAAEQAEVSPEQQQEVPGAVMQATQQQRKMPPTYTGITMQRHMVCVKITGVELSDLPPNMPSIMAQQLKRSVIMTLDLMDLGQYHQDTLDTPAGPGAEEEEPTRAVGLASSMMDLVTRVMQESDMGQLLTSGATLGIQTAGGVVLCRWDADSSSYVMMSETRDTLDTPASSLGPVLHDCCLISATPAVHTLPDCAPRPVEEHRTATDSSWHQSPFTVEVQLPPDCQLVGWQPAGAGLPASPGGTAMLLARHMGGGYLPVTVGRVSCVVGSGGDEAAMRHTAEVSVELDGDALALLCLELWYKQQPTETAATGLELLVSHVPLLVLPSSWRAAAVQLQQHMGHMGGVHPRQEYPAAVADPARDAACSLLQDLGTWLNQHNCPTNPTNSTTSLPDSVMSRLTGVLLGHTVLYGLGDVAELMVTTLQRGVQGAASSHSSWLWRAAQGAVGDAMPASETSGVPEAMPAGDGGASGGQRPLLHAAMASGQPTILEQVLRWGAQYGGPAWAWPWELEDGQGRTALHLAATQPACAALLDTITRTLPPGQVQAARSVWLHGRGGVGAAPAELLASLNGGSVGGEWVGSGMEAAGSSTAARGGVVTLDGERGGMGTAVPSSGTASLASSHMAASLPAASLQGVTPQAWLSTVIEVWTTRETDEYRAWANQQMASLECYWGAITFFMGLIACVRSFKAGCGLYEVPHIALHVIPYVIMTAAIRGATWLGDWQAWMVPAHVCHCLAYLAKAYVPIEKASIWATSASSGAHTVYVGVLVAALDQTPMPLLLVAHIIEAYCHSLACASLGNPHPLRHTLGVHTFALAVSMLCRVWQRRAFHRWQAAQQSSKQLKKAKRA